MICMFELCTRSVLSDVCNIVTVENYTVGEDTKDKRKGIIDS